MDLDLDKHWKLGGQALAESIFFFFFFRRGRSPGSALNRYGFVKEDWPVAGAQELVDGDDVMVKTSQAVLSFQKGDPTRLELKDGTGNVLLKGTARFLPDTKADMHVVNVSSYIPIPFLMSSKGYGIFVNTTFRHAWDLGATDADKLRIYVPDRNLDLYLFCGREPKDILASYTEVTGRPALPPKWSFGLWFICRMQANDFEVTSDAVNFRDRKIPCDVIGLEPGWMDKFYDYSVDKQWSKERFPIPDYAFTGPHNFFNALKRMGYKLELWLCNDYDLSYEAERRIGSKIEPKGEAIKDFLEDDTEKDVHFTEPARMDKITKPEEPWFEHLKKFVDQGVDFFKQDGSLQVCEHPDRLWGNGMTDDEMHNLYPLLYSQQMYEGFKEHTGRRPCGFTPAGWAGLQKYTGTWTGDTGGGPKTLVACLNLALSGHSLVTCDMEVATKEGIHYGFLMTWAQLDSWNYFRHPWLQGDELYSIFCAYANMRSRLVPYLYTYAHVAHTTGIPMMRPMVLEFPDDAETSNILTQWFLGRELLVSSFADQVYLPEGKWYDYWTGKSYRGPATMKYQPPENRGGALFVRANSIIPWGPLVQYIGQKTTEGMTLEIFIEPQGEAEFQLYDDDGVSFEYEDGKFSLHHIRAEFSQGDLTVGAPDELKIDKIIAHLTEKPNEVSLNGKAVPFTWSDLESKLECSSVRS